MSSKPRNPNAFVDPALREAESLDAILKEASAEEPADVAASAPEQTLVQETPPPPVRKQIRILFVTTDVSIFAENSAARQEYTALASYFDEMHVVVISERGDALPESVRLGPSAWAYTTRSRSRFMAPYDAYRLATKQLAFAAGFRADVIAATDPFEAGVAAYLIGKRHRRPWQVQVTVNPFEAYFQKEKEGNNWRAVAARFIVPRADCILVRSAYMQDVIKKRYRSTAARITLIAPFLDLTHFTEAHPAFDVREMYPNFKFVILVASSLHARNKVDFAIDACAATLLQYPTVGLVIVGSGPEQDRLQKLVRQRQLQDKVAFESHDDLVSYMKTANLLINPATTEESDITLAAAAAAGLPVLTVEGGIADALFTDGENAFVCPLDNLVCFQAALNEFLNTNELRTKFTINARTQVLSSIEQDATAYRQAYASVFEECVLQNFSETP